MPPTHDGHTHPSLDRRVTEYLTHACYTLHEKLTIEEALHVLRSGQSVSGVSQGNSQVIYFYVVNDNDQLVGILGARHLILSHPAAKVADLMSRTVIALADRETLFDALEIFALHRLLAVPVVDKDQKFLGIVELSLYTDEVVDMAHNRQLNEVFQLIGLDLEQHKQGSPLKGFQLRMPWLLANITGGLVCAALGAMFEATLQKVVILALFIPLILTLAESIAVQSMTLAIEQAASGGKLRGRIGHEAATALMLGLCSGLIVGLVSLFWRGPFLATLTIGGGVAMTMFLASMLGRAVPKIVRAMNLNPRIASGPITLAVVDIVAITLYLSTATIVLGG